MVFFLQIQNMIIIKKVNRLINFSIYKKLNYSLLDGSAFTSILQFSTRTVKLSYSFKYSTYVVYFKLILKIKKVRNIFLTFFHCDTIMSDS